jgi:hypothetical protein
LKALEYLKNLDVSTKSKTFLLTDYEFLKQDINGLDVIAEGAVARSLLVTSHYAAHDVQIRAMRLGTRVLPKLLASEVPIEIKQMDTESMGKAIDVVLLEDDAELARLALVLQFSKVRAQHYLTPEQFLADMPNLNLTQDTRFCLDKNFDHSKMNGIQLAEKLYALGYTKLYLASGESFQPGVLPEYLKVVKKYRLEDVLE